MTANRTATMKSRTAAGSAEILLVDDTPLFVRVIVNGARDTKTRWAAYDLPPVTPLDAFADYVEAATKRREIALENSKCVKDLDKAVTAIARGFAAIRDEETSRQADDILAGRKEEAFQGFEELRAQQARLTQRLKAYGEALRRQDEVVAAIKSERSIDAAEIMAPTHRDAVKAISDALVQLRLALDREEAVRAAVVDEGYDARLPSFSCGGIFGLNGRLEELDRLSREYVR